MFSLVVVVGGWVLIGGGRLWVNAAVTLRRFKMIVTSVTCEVERGVSHWWCGWVR
jgi:hypothetical protein